MHICLLTATFNRADKLSLFLESLDIAFAGLSDNCTLELFVVNNNSTDQTSQILCVPRPYKISELLTPSDLYWAEAMNYGYTFMRKKNIYFDCLLSLNDDLVLSSDSLNNLYEAILQDQGIDSEKVYLGVCTFGGKITYGCRRWSHPFTLSFSIVQNPSELRSLKNISFNMNFLCVTRQVLSKYGYLSSKFRHGAADYYYGLHLLGKNVRMVVLESSVGICERDHDDQLVKLAQSARFNINLLFKWLKSPKGFPLNERIVLARKLYPRNRLAAYFCVAKERVLIIVLYLLYSFK